MKYITCRKKKGNKVPLARCIEKCSKKERNECSAFKEVPKEEIQKLKEERGMAKEDKNVLDDCIETETKAKTETKTEGGSDLVSVVKEINTLHEEAMVNFTESVEKIFRIGELLTEQKERLAHGEFGPWIEKNLPFSRQTAANYMRVFARKEEIKLQAVGNLTEAYQLLAPPKPEPKPDSEVKTSEGKAKPEGKAPDEGKKKPADTGTKPGKEEEKKEEKEEEEEEETTMLHFALYPDQLDNVEQALEKAKVITESDKRSYCLDLICVEFNVLYPGVSAQENDDEANELRIKSAVQLLKRVEAMFNVKIPEMIDEKTGQIYN